MKSLNFYFVKSATRHCFSDGVPMLLSNIRHMKEMLNQRFLLKFRWHFHDFDTSAHRTIDTSSVGRHRISKGLCKFWLTLWKRKLSNRRHHGVSDLQPTLVACQISDVMSLTEKKKCMCRRCDRKVLNFRHARCSILGWNFVVNRQYA